MDITVITELRVTIDGGHVRHAHVVISFSSLFRECYLFQ